METTRLFLCSLALAATAALPARAETVDRLSPYPPPAKSPASATARDVDESDSQSSDVLSRRRGEEVTAYLLVLGGTAIPILAGAYLLGNDAGPLGGTLLVSGLLLGPSLGQFYAGEPGVYTGILGAAGRVVGGLFLLVGFEEAFGSQLCRGLGGMGPGETKCDDNDGNAKTTVGIAVYSAATLYSLVDTHFALRRKWRLSDRAGLTPILHFARTGEPAAGAAAWLRF